MMAFRAHRQQVKSASPVPVKRVIRQNGQFICGVCRKGYGDEGRAQHCLEGCLARWLGAKAPVAVDPGATARERYRCGFCRRGYTDRNQAQSCADACRSKTKVNVEQERAVTEVRAQAPAPAAAAEPEKARPVVRRDQLHKFLREGRKLICRKCGAEKLTLDAVIACYDAHPVTQKKPKEPKVEPTPKVKAPRPAATAETAPAAAVSVSAAPPPAAAGVAVAKADKGEDDKHKFRRDGARYICRHCSAKHFTRGEVVACFDGHAAAG